MKSAGILLLLGLPLVLEAQPDLVLGFEPVPFDIGFQNIQVPFIVTPASYMLEWTKIDFNPLEYRSVTLAYDTVHTCPLVIESRPAEYRQFMCGMISPYAGRSSLAFSPAFLESPWEGNDGMYVHVLDKPLKKNTAYTIRLKMYIPNNSFSNTHDSATITGVNIYLLNNDRELSELMEWNPEKLKKQYDLAQSYPDQCGEYWLGSGKQPAMQWIQLQRSINPVKDIRYIVLGAQRNVPIHVNVVNAPILLDDFILCRKNGDKAE